MGHLPGAPFPGDITRWGRARELLGLPPLANTSAEEDLGAYLAGSRRGKNSPLFIGGVYDTGLRFTCRASVYGVHLEYLAVWKSGSMQFCSMLKRMGKCLHRRSSAPAKREPRLVFTFVRDPVRHFLSGYSEIVYRATAPRGPDAHALHYTWLKHMNGSSEHVKLPSGSTSRARAFVRDLVAGRTRPRFDLTEVHAYPQHAFLQRYINFTGNVPHFVGRLEEAEADWAALGELVTGTAATALPGSNPWPRLGSSGSRVRTHGGTDSQSGSLARAAMARVLGIPEKAVHVGPLQRAALLAKAYATLRAKLSDAELRRTGRDRASNGTVTGAAADKSAALRLALGHAATGMGTRGADGNAGDAQVQTGGGRAGALSAHVANTERAREGAGGNGFNVATPSHAGGPDAHTPSVLALCLVLVHDYACLSRYYSPPEVCMSSLGRDFVDEVSGSRAGLHGGGACPQLGGAATINRTLWGHREVRAGLPWQPFASLGPAPGLAPSVRRGRG